MSRAITFHRDAYSAGLACKVSGHSADVGFVFSKAEMDRLAELRKGMDGTSRAVSRAGAMVGAGLGAVALGLVVATFGRKVGSR